MSGLVPSFNPARILLDPLNLSGAFTPKVQTPSPITPPAAPTPGSAQDAGAAYLASQAQAAGPVSTLLTGGSGVTSQPTLGRAQLLGG